ncbi:UV-endonuclease UvdE-domain-containing protein [Kalaharituber pfeilii]|nr:UV-endonuclease UvdE-domain-containing protein [Kalaharituber pfeilii]
MPKRKGAALLQSPPEELYVEDAEVLKAAPIMDAKADLAASPDSSELSSPPDSDREVMGLLDMVEEEEPMSKYRKVKGKSKNPLESVLKLNRSKRSISAVKPKDESSTKNKNKKKIIDNDDGSGSASEGTEERPPPVNSDYIPIPWKGRLGFACLNTYLRYSNPPVFCSRTCRLDTILKQGLQGQKFVEAIGLANTRDLTKLIHWNERYGIKFLRISSEMFPFASHIKYGYSLDFAKDNLAEAGRVAMKYGHRLTAHPGQYTQLGSPRKEVVENAVRDLKYHCQMLSFLGLEGQADRDAVMIIHMGGVFGDKAATLQRFKENYTNCVDEEAKRRLVLENDDMAWSVHDLLPVCQELNIPLVLDWHHHNIVHDPSVREGSLDILPLMDQIKETWTRKRITQKQHYSEPRDGTVSNHDRRRHSARVKTLPPCEDKMDLMIEAKDKEQAVFALMRKFKMDGWDKIQDMKPHVRDDENKPEPAKRAKKAKSTKGKGKKGKEGEGEVGTEIVNGQMEVEPKAAVKLIPEEEVGMGGPDGRVYWPEGKEEWLCQQKKVRKRKEKTVEGKLVVDEEKEGPEVICAEEGEEVQKRKKAKKQAVQKANDSRRELKGVTDNAKADVFIPAESSEGSEAEAVVSTQLVKSKSAVSRKKKSQFQKRVSTAVIATTTPATGATAKRRKTVSSNAAAVTEVSVAQMPATTIIDGNISGSLTTEGTRSSTRARKMVNYGEVEVDGKRGKGRR